jgi:hypothetical protein
VELRIPEAAHMEWQCCMAWELPRAQFARAAEKCIRKIHDEHWRILKEISPRVPNVSSKSLISAVLLSFREGKKLKYNAGVTCPFV